MIKYCDRLYADEESRKKLSRIKRALETKRKTADVYCILLSSDGKNLFDIIYCGDPAFAYYSRDTVYIAGLACSREAARKLLVTIAQEIYAADQEFKVRDYFALL